MKTVILCGGMGTRLREETEFIPKPLVPIGSLPILWHIMKIYSHYGFKDFILCLGYKGYKIKEYFNNFNFLKRDYTLDTKTKRATFHEDNDTEEWNITFAETGENANTGARIKKIEKYIDENDFFLTYGDGVADINIKDLYKFHKNHKKIGTITAVRPLSRFGVLDLNENMVKDFTKKTLVHEGRIDGGFFVFNKKIFNYLTKDDNCMLEGEPLKKLAQNNQFMAYLHNGFWQCMDTINQMKLLNDMWDKNPPWKVWND